MRTEDEQEFISQQLAKMTGMLRDNLPALQAEVEIKAKLIRVKYLALVKEGFTEAQALELSKTI